MPTVQSQLVDRGVTFANAFVVNPVCCPSRASTLTGRYSHSTGVYNNNGPYGGWPSFRTRERSTIATWLEGGGYRTGFFGKYLNNYGGPFVPPGWSRWVAFAPPNAENYYTYRLNIDGTMVDYGSDPGDYSTDVLAGEASSFIRGAGAAPLFVLFAPFAPHGPPTPAPRHEGAFAGLPPWRPASYNEPNATDKPAWVRSLAPLTAGDGAAVDAFRRGQLESLLAVDDAVGELLDALADTGRLDETLFVFTSDNGYLWGEHRWRSKVVAYDESIRVPLVVRYDGVAQTAATSPRLVANIDLAPTFAQAGGRCSARRGGPELPEPPPQPERGVATRCPRREPQERDGAAGALVLRRPQRGAHVRAVRHRRGGDLRRLGRSRPAPESRAEAALRKLARHVQAAHAGPL